MKFAPILLSTSLLLMGTQAFSCSMVISDDPLEQQLSDYPSVFLALTISSQLDPKAPDKRRPIKVTFLPIGKAAASADMFFVRYVPLEAEPDACAFESKDEYKPGSLWIFSSKQEQPVQEVTFYAGEAETYRKIVMGLPMKALSPEELAKFKEARDRAAESSDADSEPSEVITDH